MKLLYRLLTTTLFSILLLAAQKADAQYYLLGSTDTATTCTGFLFDSGDSLGDYGGNEDFEFRIFVPGSSTITLNVDSADFGGGDNITIYDGPTTSDPELQSQTNNPTGPYFSTGNYITIVWHTNGSSFGYGIAFNWTANFVPDILISDPGTACAGDSLTFMPTLAEVGDSSSVAWFLNSVQVSTDSIFGTTALIDGDSVYAVVYTNGDTSCFSATSDTSNLVIADLTPNVAPSVTISASATTVCSTDSVVFTVTDSTNGGDADFAWFLNGSPVGSNLYTYQLNAPTDLDTVHVVMTPEPGGCYSPATVSDSIGISVFTTVTASVSLAATSTSICAGDSVVFTATPTNEGGSPVYAWTLNGGSVGTNSTTYTNSALVDNDEVKVTMASSVATGCLIDSISADSVVISVTATTTASVAVTKDIPNVCSADSVVFTAAPTNGGGAPTYSWTLNGGSVGTNSPTYGKGSLSNNDIVKVTMASDFNGGCLIDSISADSIVVPVTISVTASVSLAGDPSICAGNTVNFVASPTNEGSSPVYSWTLNGGSVGTNSPLYSNASLSDGDEVEVTMASSISSGCVLDSISTDSIVMNVNPNPSAGISGSTDVLCFGDSTGDATATGAGGTEAGTYDFLWSDGQTTATAINMPSGTHLVTVSDDSTCFDTVSVFIDQPAAPLSLGFAVTDVTTFGGSNGAITATPSGGAGGYGHEWQNGVTSATVSGLASGWYTDTLSDANGCVFYDSAFIDQPSLLLGGEIRIGGATSVSVCDEDTVGEMLETAAVVGGIGTKTYTWQYSHNLLNWNPYPGSNTIDYTLNDSISKITFIRRRVIDQVNDSAFSNVLFLNYVPDVLINIIGLETQYCDNSPVDILFGSPSGPGTGAFINNAYVDNSTKTFDPSSATAGGAYNNVTYTYTSPEGCFSSGMDSAIVYTSTVGTIGISQNIFSKNDPVDTLTSTYPSSGVFAGVGVYKAGGIWQFNPALVDSSLFDSTLNITFEYTNPNGCISRDTIQIMVIDNVLQLTTNYSSSAEFSTCYYDGTDTLYAKIPVTDTVTSFAWLIWRENMLNIVPVILPVNSYTFGTFTDAIKLPVDPDSLYPYQVTPPYEGGPTPQGVTKVLVEFRFTTTTNANITSLTRNLELVNLAQAKVSPDQQNSNGTLSLPFQYCEDVDSTSFSAQFLSILPRTTTKTFTVTPSDPDHLKDNMDGTAVFRPSKSPAGNKSMVFTYTDVASGCSIDTTYALNVDVLPTVTLNNLNPTYCSNDGIINFWGSPYATNKGNFSSPTAINLGLTHVNGDSIASINASANSVGAGQQMSYVFQSPVTGCINSDTVLFDVDTIPRLRILSLNGTEYCVSDTANNQLDGQVFNTGTGIFVGLIGDSITGPGIVNRNDVQGRADFNASLAGVGNHAIRFHFTNKTTFCYNFVDTIITVNELPNPVFSASDANMCMTAQDSATFTYNGLDPGTSVYGIPGGSNNPITQFRPVLNSDIQFGGNEVVHTFTHSVTGCVNRDTITVTVDTFPVVSIFATPGAYCFNGGTFGFSGSPNSPGNPLGFTPSYFNSVSLSYNQPLLTPGQNTGSYSPDSNDIGLHNLSYNYTDPVTGCFNGDTIQIEIYDIPHLELKRVDTSLALLHCLGTTDTYLKLKNGVPDPDPISYLIGPGFLDSTSTAFNPDSAGVGIHTVTYKTTDPNGCYNEIDSTIEVLATSDAGFVMDTNAACIDPLNTISIDPKFDGGALSKFTFHGTDKFSVSLATFYLDSAVVGANPISYTYDDGNGCAATSYDTIFVSDTPSVAFTVPGDFCFNGGTGTLNASPASLGSSYFSSATLGAINSSPLGNGVDSLDFVLDSLDIGTHSVSYTHVDANGCETVEFESFEIKDIPRLSISLIDTVSNTPIAGDGNVCALQEKVTLIGVTTSNASTTKLGGYFTGSVYGTTNNLVATDTSSTGEYGTVPTDAFFADTVYYHYQDPEPFGCYNKISRTLQIKQLPPPQFTIVPGGNPNDKNLCPDQTGLTSSHYDSLGLSGNPPNNWPTGPTGLTRSWRVNGLPAKVAKQFNPGFTISDDSSVYDGFNIITQIMTDKRWTPNCITQYSDTFYLDTFPVVDIIIDSLYCTNEGNIVLKVDPPSPGAPYASTLTSSNLNVSSSLLNVTLPTGVDSTVISSSNITPLPAINSKVNLKTTYTFKEPSTFCVTAKTEEFEFKRAPILSFPTKAAYCPYNPEDSILFEVNSNPAPGIPAGLSDVISGNGWTSTTLASGKAAYKPGTFADSLLTVKDSIKYIHTDADGCVDSLTRIYTVKNQPRLTLDVVRDSVCFDDPAFNLQIMYYDTTAGKDSAYTALTGPNPLSGDKNYFEFESLFPNGGQTSFAFNPRFDSKNDTDGVVTQVTFIGTYGGVGECYDTISDVIVTHPKPHARLYLDGLCAKYKPLMHGDSSFMDTVNFSPSDFIQSYFWQVDDSTSLQHDPADSLSVDYEHWKTVSDGIHDLYLTVKSVKGCSSDKLNVKKTFVKSPEANFEWYMNDECIGDTMEFRSTTQNPSSDPITLFWDFGDGTSMAAGDTISHMYSGTQHYLVMLEVSQGNDCKDTSIQDVYIRPVISSYPYLDNFDDPSGYTGWVAWNEESDTTFGGSGSETTFELGTRTNGNMQTAASGSNAWYTSGVFDTTAGHDLYNNSVYTSVISPCFNFDSVNRPMLTLQTLYDIEGNDGAVLQFTTDTATLANADWVNVGDYFTKSNLHYKTGINWYNKQNIFGSPGRQSDQQGKKGWTDNSMVDSSIGWLEARHDIDVLIGQPYARFRIAFASGSEQREEGFAFDDFEIRERTKNIVYEIFTNATGNSLYSIMEGYDDLVEEYEKDIVDIQYHTAFPLQDALNLDNTSDPSARALHYSITEVPYLRMDGVKYSNFVTHPTFGSFTHKPRTLEDPKFNIELNFDKQTDNLNTMIECLDTSFATSPVDVVVHVAMLEKEIAGNNFTANVASSFQSGIFNNTLKRLYPNAAGTTVLGMTNQSPNNQYSFNTTLLYDKFYGNKSGFKAVVFVQNKTTKLIYQAEYVDINKTTTIGEEEYEHIVSGGVEYNLYPNPTTGITHMDFSNPLENTYVMTIFNQVGMQVKEQVIAAGTQYHNFEMSGLKPGMYFITLNDGEHKVAIKKLMVSQ